MEQKIKVCTVPCDGDLYRFFYTDTGEVICIRMHPMMRTAYNDVQWNELPNEVKRKFENHFCR